jgi:hypothetical protein
MKESRDEDTTGAALCFNHNDTFYLKRRIKSGRIPASAVARIKGVLRDVTNPQSYLASVGII